jgi:hypothetical protein
MILGQQFTKQWQSQVSSQLSCFDRVILTGYLPFWSAGYVNGWIGGVLGIRHKDFLPQMKQLSQKLVDFAKRKAKRCGAPFHNLQGKCRKDAMIDRIDRERKHPQGLIAVLQTQESGRTVKLRWGQGRPRFEFAYRPQRTLYFYLNDRRFGRMFVRIQTWFPWRIQIYVNGHEWLARKLRKRRIPFEQHDNAFLSLGDPRRAQAIADEFAGLPWAKLLNQFASQFNCLLTHPWLKGRHYTWVIDQAEFSTDVLFHDRNVLAGLYPHQVGFNGLKLYEKLARLLRVETVINDPKGFKVQDTRASYDEVRELVQSQQHAGRQYAGFNVAKKDDVDFFAAILAGEHHLHGFRTEDIRLRLNGPCHDPILRRRQAQAIGRRLKRLHIRALIAKIPRSHRWRTSYQGSRLLTKIIRLYYHGLPQAA